MPIMLNYKRKAAKRIFHNQSGFSLLEVVIAMMVLMIFMLGTLTVFTYAVQYNRGNNLRSQAITVLQQEAELYRSYKFVKDTTATNPELNAGPKSAKDAKAADNTYFTIKTTIDNDPVTAGIQTANDATATLKEIKITVTPKVANANWEKAVSATLTIQRVRGN